MDRTEEILELIPKVRRMAYGRVVHADELEDLVQAGCLGLVEAASLYSGEPAGFPLEALRYARREIRREVTFLRDGRTSPVTQDPQDPRQDQVQDLESSETLKQIQGALESLTPNEAASLEGRGALPELPRMTFYRLRAAARHKIQGLLEHGEGKVGRFSHISGTLCPAGWLI